MSNMLKRDKNTGQYLVTPNGNTRKFFFNPKLSPLVQKYLDNDGKFIIKVSQHRFSGVDILPHAPINIVETNKHFGKRWKGIRKIQH